MQGDAGQVFVLAPAFLGRVWWGSLVRRAAERRLAVRPL